MVILFLFLSEVVLVLASILLLIVYIKKQSSPRLQVSEDLQKIKEQISSR